MYVVSVSDARMCVLSLTTRKGEVTGKNRKDLLQARMQFVKYMQIYQLDLASQLNVT